MEARLFESTSLLNKKLHACVTSAIKKPLDLSKVGQMPQKYYFLFEQVSLHENFDLYK